MISKIQYITQGNDKDSQLNAVRAFCKGGAEWVQLRVKNAGFSEWFEIAREARKITFDAGAKLIINDSVQIAIAAQADGVHLGRSDMHIQDAREMMGQNYIIGGTANTFGDIEFLASQGVNYIGLGPFRFTKTKENLSPILGIEGYQELISQSKNDHIHTPIVAIGGITHKDISAILHTGLHGIAISGEVLHAQDPQKAMQQINAQFCPQPVA